MTIIFSRNADGVFWLCVVFCVYICMVEVGFLPNVYERVKINGIYMEKTLQNILC